MPTRRQVLLGSVVSAGVAAAHSVAAVAGPATAATAPVGQTGRRPNFVVVLADDLGYAELGSYGQKLIETPHLDQLAAEGLRFTDAYSGAAVCAPSRCSLLTGLHSGHSTVRQNPEGGPQGSLTESDTTFAELLRTRGYRTALFGKWGFGPEVGNQESHPNARGFEEFFGYITHGHAHDYYPHYLFHNGDRVELPENAGTRTGSFAPDLFRDRALEFIGQSRDEPFLLFITPNIPHAPSDIPDQSQYADKPWPAADRGHAAQVSTLDSQIGEIVDALRANDLLDDTILIVTSDNGPHEEGGFNPDLFDANGPLRGYKRNLFEGGIRIPLIAWSPGTIPAGTTARPTAQIDLMPTLAELAGAPVPDDIDGISAAGLLGGVGTAPSPAHLFWYRREPGSTTRANAADGGSVTRVAEAVRKDHWKAVRIAPGHDRPASESDWTVQLFDLGADLGETRDVAATHPAVASSLVGLMRSSWVPNYSRTGFGLHLDVPDLILPGTTQAVTLRLTNGSTRRWTNVRLHLDLPTGWTATGGRTGRGQTLEPGASLEVSWRITVPTTSTGDWVVRGRAQAVSDRHPLRFEQERTFTAPPPAPTSDAWLSDLAWISATNGWGPVERDRSNGKDMAGDGPLISFGGTTYEKGLGVHATSEILYHLGGNVRRLVAKVGIDDFSARQSPNGSTIAQVWADEEKVYDSGVLTAATGPRDVDVDVIGARIIRLVVTNAPGSGTSFDHTSWADARVLV